MRGGEEGETQHTEKQEDEPRKGGKEDSRERRERRRRRGRRRRDRGGGEDRRARRGQRKKQLEGISNDGHCEFRNRWLRPDKSPGPNEMGLGVTSSDPPNEFNGKDGTLFVVTEW